MPSKKIQTVAITGASGYVGAVLTDHFSAMGWHVRGLVRNASMNPPNANISYSKYDLSDESSIPDLSGVDYLVHTAYVKLGDDKDAVNKNIDGARRLLATSRKYGVKGNIFLSTMSAHEGAVSAYGRQKLAVEELFQEINGTVLKCGLIIGNGGIVKDMSNFMRSKHVVPLIGGGHQPLQIVAVTDLAKIIEKVATNDIRGTFVVATPRVYRYKDFYTQLAKHLNIKVLFVPVPLSLLMIMFKIAALMRLPLKLGQDNLLGLKMLRAMDSKQDLERLGVELSELEAALENMTNQEL